MSLWMLIIRKVSIALHWLMKKKLFVWFPPRCVNAGRNYLLWERWPLPLITVSSFNEIKPWHSEMWDWAGRCSGRSGGQHQGDVQRGLCVGPVEGTMSEKKLIWLKKCDTLLYVGSIHSLLILCSFNWIESFKRIKAN